MSKEYRAIVELSASSGMAKSPALRFLGIGDKESLGPLPLVLLSGCFSAPVVTSESARHDNKLTQRPL